MSVLWYVFLSGLLALATALVFSRLVSRIPIGKGDFTDAQKSKLVEISSAIAEGAMAFLNREYRVMAVFMAIFAVIVVALVGWSEGGMVGWTSALAFLCGAGISVLAGYIGMKSATRGNVRTTAAAVQSVAGAFRVAFNSGAVMGFALVGLVLVGMGLVYLILGAILSGESPQRVMEALAGFGLGGSSIALFARVGGGIYTKAADVGADLVGKIEENIPEDDPRNPAVIADNVGDNVGDIAGMGADLFGSVAESTCAALVIGAVAFATDTQALLYPLLITAVGVPIALVSSAFARTGSERGVEPALKRALIVSSLLMAVVMWFVTRAVLPGTFTFYGAQYTALGVYYTFLTGLIAGLLMGIVTEIYTSHRYKPVKDLAHAAETGPATNIIYGIALGYRSSMIPVVFIAITIFVGYFFAGMYGIAVASLGMLGTVAIALTMDGFGPVADNAGGIAEMAGLGENIRKRTDALDSAGNTTAAIGKGFAIGSAALTALALFSAFLVRSNVHTLDLLKPIVITFLFIGALLPFVFTAMTLKSVGKAALAMIKEVRRQFATIPGLRDAYQLTQASLDKLKAGGLSRERLARLQSIVGKPHPTEEKLLTAVRELLARYTPAVPDEQIKAVINEGVVNGKPDYRACVDISTKASLREMILPGAQVILTPIVVGGLFGAEALAGLLAGSMASGVVLAISSANSGGAWDNAKKWIETGKLGGKGSDTHKAAVVGDTVGDPFKDTSGPSLNILIKLQAIISLVFAPFFAHMSSLLH